MPRIDAELVRRGLARSRGQAGDLVRAGLVRVDDRPVSKPSHPVQPDAPISVQTSPGQGDVGRGAAKLRGALDDLVPGPEVADRRCLDVGASTGGFTQVLLERGAGAVVALDVGHGQLASEVAADPRVDDRSGQTVRGLDPAEVGGPFDLVVADLSFISTALVSADLARLTAPGGDLLVLVKPQFEVGRERLGKDGVVRSEQQRRESVQRVRQALLDAGFAVLGEAPSRLAGGSGNAEFFLWAARRPTP